MISSCDCKKKNLLSYTCMHVHLVEEHPIDFNCPIEDSEEPQSFFIRVERITYLFSVAQSSRAYRNHCSKRIIDATNGRKRAIKKGFVLDYMPDLLAIVNTSQQPRRNWTALGSQLA
jgi:hypothetical protein